jgi:hypothetical protein
VADVSVVLIVTDVSVTMVVSPPAVSVVMFVFSSAEQANPKTLRAITIVNASARFM